MSYTFEQLKDLWTSAGGAAEDAEIAAAVGLAESSGRASIINKNNRNGSWDVGLWQVNTIHAGAFGLPTIKDYKKPADDAAGSKEFVDHLTTASNNAAAAVRIKKAQGFNAWVAYKTNAHAKFIPKPPAK